MKDPREGFGREAEKYLGSAVHADADALAGLVSLVGPQGGRLLDVATGAGHTAFAFAPFVDLVVAADLTPQMLRVTRAAAADRGLPNITTTLAAAERAPFRPGSFAGVSCRTAAHHFDDVAAFLAESSRVLRPGGWFLLVDTVGADDDEADARLDELERRRDPSHRRNLRVGEWIALVRAAGLAVRHTATSSKRLGLQAWLDRMSVAPDEQARLKAMVQDSTGAFRGYLRPEPDGFHLTELVLLADQPGVAA